MAVVRRDLLLLPVLVILGVLCVTVDGWSGHGGAGAKLARLESALVSKSSSQPNQEKLALST